LGGGEILPASNILLAHNNKGERERGREGERERGREGELSVSGLSSIQ